MDIDRIDSLSDRMLQLASACPAWVADGDAVSDGIATASSRPAILNRQGGRAPSPCPR